MELHGRVSAQSYFSDKSEVRVSVTSVVGCRRSSSSSSTTTTTTTTPPPPAAAAAAATTTTTTATTTTTTTTTTSTSTRVNQTFCRTLVNSKPRHLDHARAHPKLRQVPP